MDANWITEKILRIRKVNHTGIGARMVVRLDGRSNGAQAAADPNANGDRYVRGPQEVLPTSEIQDSLSCQQLA